MNKERELLKRALAALHGCSSSDAFNLRASIRTYLAPEPEDKPVAWLNGVSICPEVGYDYTITEKHPKDLGWTPIYSRPAEPESNEPVAWMLGCQTMGGDIDWKLSWSRSGGGVCHRLQGSEYEKPLYAKPAQESAPMTDEEIEELFYSGIVFEDSYLAAFTEGFKLAEKHHGVGGEE